MTYKSHPRHPLETILSLTFTFFLISFVCSLCVGNYLRASRARERQSGRREERKRREERRRRIREAGGGQYSGSDFTSYAESVNVNHNGGINTASKRPDSDLVDLEGGRRNDNDASSSLITGMMSA